MLAKQIKKWKHVFKLDPNRALPDRALHLLCQSQTDAIIVGGTDGITYQNTAQLLKRVQTYDKPCIQEVSTMDAVVPGFDGYLIPAVLNSSDSNWFLGAHLEALKTYGDLIPWDQIVMEGYVTCNPRAKVSRLTKAKTDLDINDMIAYVRLADRLYHLPIFYVEYSGILGDIEMVKAAKNECHSAQLFYGGGLRNKEQVQQIKRWADTIVIGNLIYVNVERAVETAAWVKQMSQDATKGRQNKKRRKGGSRSKNK